MCTEMANRPSPYGSDLVSTNCRHLAASKIPKERMEILSVRPQCQWSGTARNKLVKWVQMHIRSLLHMLRFPRYVINSSYTSASGHCHPSRAAYRRGSVWRYVAVGKAATRIRLEPLTVGQVRAGGWGEAIAARPCQPTWKTLSSTSSQGHLCSKISETFCRRFRE